MKLDAFTVASWAIFSVALFVLIYDLFIWRPF